MLYSTPSSDPPASGHAHLFDSVMDALPQQVAVLDARGCIVAVNQAWQDFQAAHDDEVIRGEVGDNYPQKLTHASARFPEAYPRDALDGLRAVQSGKKKGFTLRYECPGRGAGESQWFEMHLAGFSHAGERYTAVAHQEVTGRVRSEARLRASEERFRAFMEDAPLGILRTTPAGEVLACKPAPVELLAYDSAEELEKMDLSQNLYVDPEARNRLVKELADGTLTHAVAEWRRRDGSPISVRLTKKGIRDRSGSLMEIESIVEDVTEQLRTAEQLRHTQKMELLGELTGGVVHDFNNLLNVVLANAELLAMELREKGMEEPSELTEIRRAGRKGTQMVQRFLGFSRKSPFAPAPLDLAATARNTVTTFGSLLSEEIRIRVEAGDAIPLVMADEGSVEQVIMNLLTNARDALDGRGEVTVSLTRRDPPDSSPAAHRPRPEEGFVCLEISDEGSGMDEATLPRVFEPFFTTKPLGEGTGLGMSMVRHLVQEHGGEIDISSEPGVGTTVRLFFPAISSPAAVSDTAAASAPDHPRERASVRRGAGGTETILLAEDDEAVLQAARRILTRGGYTVLSATDGAAAFALLQEHRNAVDLVVTDLVMPRVRGDELIRRMRASGFHVPVVVSSGHSHEEGLPPAVLKDGRVSLLFKPWSVFELLAAVRGALEPMEESA